MARSSLLDGFAYGVLNEIIGPLNLKEITGKNINFEGAITFDRKDKIYITPTKIEFLN